MVFSYACLTLQRILLPAVLVLAALYRPVGISFVYLLMFFISPFIPIATNRNFKGSVTAYLIILIALSTILLLCHVALQVTIIALKIDALFSSCSFTEQLLRHIGFIDFRNLKPFAIIEWLTPEVVVFITSLAVYLATKKLTAKKSETDQLESGEADAARVTLQNGIEGEVAATTSGAAAATTAGVASNSPHNSASADAGPNFDALIKISPLFCLATLFFAAVLRPSVPGGFYFLVFLLSGSYWATFQSLQRKGFGTVLRFLMIILVLHALCVVSYQMPWSQQYLDSNSLIARLLALEPLITSSCVNDIRIIFYNSSYKLDSYKSPILLLFCYFAFAITARNLSTPPIVAKPAATAFGQQLENGSNKFNRQFSLMTQTSRSSKKESWTKTQRLNVSLRREHRPTNTEPTETTPLVRHNTRKKSSNPNQADALFETEAITGGNDIPLDTLQGDRRLSDLTPSIFEQIWYGFVSVGGFIYQNSYIFTNILMMAWSIVYHSWLTFVLLLWANVLWMIPNQRKAMMRSSPFIVIYAELLLVAQYIYGMNLTNDELPAKVDTTGINLAQIGIDRPQAHGMQPCVPLIVKTSFLLMFWVTLRQFCKEKTLKRHSHVGLITPLQLGSDTKKTSKFLKKAGVIIKNLLVRLWIWLLVLVIFLCAITGKNMTGFRICYMALFLFFLLVFQSSSKAWVKVMYGFWLFLIFYAMFILILIYTYQFDKFDEYWNYYLNISETLQSDIGLERYKTKDLFLHLVSPTIIVILTVIQVHYFHKRFIESLQQPPVPLPSNSSMSTRRRLSETESRRSQLQLQTIDATVLKESIRDLIRVTLKKIKHKSVRIMKNFKNCFWRFMELHFIKVVYISAFVCSVSEVCLLHVVFVGLCLIGVISRTSVQIFVSRIISFVVTVIILSKMIYQIAYLDHSHYDIACNNGEKGNNADWFGLSKTSDATGGLMGLLKRYIIYMVIVTLHAVVSLRQHQMRNIYGGTEPALPKVLFPHVVRDDAEKNLEGMVKYLFNYGYYKFGMEISMISLVTTITFRQDVVAVAYAVWLFVLLCFDRPKCAKIWGVFQCFIGISIFLQYIVLVGFPPNLCLYYPWTNSPYSESIQRWAMLPGNLHFSHVSKLIFDFVLLLFINRQKRVFKIETNALPGVEYPGGNNKSVVNDIARLGQLNFENPTRDFLSNIRNYLDVFKNAVFCGFYWVTLAVVFLAGTNIGDLLALGYLVGAFMFLWQGSEFYLRPIHTIVRRWNWLITYNVANILIKTCLQMAGCIFMQPLTTNCCWLVHMVGISCASHQVVIPSNDEETFGAGDCPAVRMQVALLWDAICFAFLLFQMRIFKSHYFCHIIIDTKANSILASRGAEIIEDLRQKQIEHRHLHEEEVLLKIKRKMEKIRATQQKMLKPVDKPTHFDAEAEVIEAAPLARDSSFSSCQGSGYHTPEEEDGDLDAQMLSDECSTTDSASTNGSSEDQAELMQDTLTRAPQRIRVECADCAELNALHGGRLAAAGVHECEQVGGTCLTTSLFNYSLQTHLKPNTPSSEHLTIPFEGFLDVNRLSVCSAPNSDLMAAPLQEEEDSTESSEVFAPPAGHVGVQPPTTVHTLLPPILTAVPTSCSLSVNVSGGSSVISSNLTANGGVSMRHRRQSSVNAVSWNETVSIKCAPKDTRADAEAPEDVTVTLREKSLHRRHLSMGNATYSMDDQGALQNERRRYSNVSWAREESYLSAAARPNSWGPVEHGYPVPGIRQLKKKEIKTHPQAVRAGDYYMFEDMDDKFELDLIDDEVDYLEDEDKITQSEKKMNRRKTLIDVWKDMHSVEYRRQMYMRQRSYASAPGSRIGIKIDEDLDAEGEVGLRNSTLSEPLDYAHCRSTSEYFMEHGKGDKQTPERPPTTSKEALAEDVPDAKKKGESDITELTDKGSDEDIEANPIIRLLEAFLVSLTIRLNRFSRHYRYVNKILAEEKKALKEASQVHQRLGRSSAAAMFNFFKRNIESDEREDASVEELPAAYSTTTSNNALSNTNIPQNNSTTTTTTATTTPTFVTATLTSNNNNASLESQSPDQPPPTPQPHVVDFIELPLDTVDAKEARPEPGTSSPLTKTRKSEGVPEIRIKAPSFDRSRNGSGSLSKQWSYEKVDSTSDFAFDEEDFTTRDHNIIIEVLISAWFALLSNTDLICYIVVFINQVVSASIISLPLPIMVFLWGTLTLPRPTKTFWVTLIAYTQAIVLIKCIFQFKLIWANYVNLPNQPLAPAKILGVEFNQDYATYDLLLLLVLFFHRFILKSQGLWKSEFKDIMAGPSNISPPSDTEDEEPAAAIEVPAVENQDADAINAQAVVPAEQKPKVSVSPDSRSLSSSIVESDEYIAGMKRLKRAKYLSSLRKFFLNLVYKSRLPSDVYALMFLCDFINFFVLLFGFTAFGSQQAEGDGGVQTYLAENKVPIPFLIMLLVQFILIVIDRALYLRKALVYKIVFHFFSVIGIHIWMFFVVPFVTERSFYALAPPIIFYIIKCFYMLLSSHQIKCGYPQRILGNFLTKGFAMPNMIAFRVYMQIPFLYELRTILDWVCTETTMTLFDWLKMEDIFSEIYFIRCSRQMESDFPALRGEKKALFSKLLMGGTIILLIVVSIWGPLCLFALGNAVGQSNVPHEVSVSVRIGSYDPIYSTNSRESTHIFDEAMYGDMKNAYMKNKSAITFLSGYDPEDIAAVKLPGNSPTLWNISPPDKERLLADLKNDVILTARFTYSLTRIPPSKNSLGTVGAEITLELNETFPGRQALIDILDNKMYDEEVVLPNIVPKFIKVLNSGELGSVHQLTLEEKDINRPLIIKTHAVNGTDNIWWEIVDSCRDNFYVQTLSKLPQTECDSGIVMYTFNDKKFPSTFSFLTAGGIIGLYTTFVLLASRFLKSFISGMGRKIMFEDLPYVDRVLQLCLDIYLVREALEFTLEEDLFAKLLFLYRSPETMIKWTRPKEEVNDDETDTESLRSRNSGRRS